MKAQNGGRRLPYGRRKRYVEDTMGSYAQDGELNWLGRPEVDDPKIDDATREARYQAAWEAFRDEIRYELGRSKKSKR